jgi:hypothetical protein
MATKRTGEFESVEVPFDDHSIRACESDGVVWVALKPLCERFGLDYQFECDFLAAEDWATPQRIRKVGPAKGGQRPLWIDLDALSFWLKTIEPTEVGDAASLDTLVAYREHACGSLQEHFFGKPGSRKWKDRAKPDAATIATPLISSHAKRIAALEACVAAYEATFAEIKKTIVVLARFLRELPRGATAQARRFERRLVALDQHLDRLRDIERTKTQRNPRRNSAPTPSKMRAISRS